MPSKYPFHKKPSHGPLLNHLDPNEGRSYQASPIDSPLQSPAYSPHSATSASPLPNNDDNADDYRHGHSNRSQEEAHFYQQALPTRSQSHRTPPSTHISHNPSINLVAQSIAGVVPSSIDENPDSFYQQVSPSIAPKDDQRKRRYLWLGNLASTKEPANSNGAINPQRAGRSISVRRKPPAPPISTETNIGLAFQQNLRSSVAAEEEKRGDRTGLGSSYVHSASEGPPIPAKDPSRSLHYSNPQQHESLYNRTSLQGVAPPDNVNPPPLDRQASANSAAWENSARPVLHPHRPHSEVSNRQPPLYQPSPTSATSSSSHPLPSRGAPETLQQYYQTNSRPASRQSSGLPSPIEMPQPPPGRGSNNPPPQRQPSELIREGSGYHPPYPQPGPELNQPPVAPPYRSQLNPVEANYRAPPQSSSMAPPSTADPGRSTPPPNRSRDDLAGLDPAQLLIELQEKYRKVKKHYFDKEAQVQQLQNTLAHQRLAQSRTSLDDNEYANRFSRLDGAINNLSFNIRRDWRAVPPWLGPHVNRDAPTLPTREMTAVGRASISRWLVDELLDRYFHPSLEPTLSAHLKIIEKNLRRYAAPTPSEEEKDALLARISNWRLATLDGLHDMLFSSKATEYQSQLTEQLVEKMTASLSMSLKEPSPPGLEGSVAMIIELAVGIAANLPLESRDVFVEYIAPGVLLNEAYMKVESGLPPLTNPGEGILEGGAAGAGEKTSEDRSATEPKDNVSSEERPVRPVSSSGASSIGAGAGAGTSGSGGPSTKETKKKSMFGGLMGGSRKTGTPASSSAAHQQQQQQQVQPAPTPKEDRVRFAAFMAVEVRGRSVLVKAPVYIQ